MESTSSPANNGNRVAVYYVHILLDIDMLSDVSIVGIIMATI